MSSTAMPGAATMSFVPFARHEPACGHARGIVHRLARAAIIIAFLSSGLVLAEPAPYDALMLGLVVLLPAIGLVRITPMLTAFLALNLVIASGGLVSATLSFEPDRSLSHTLITLFLGVGAFVLAAFVARAPASDTRLILDGWIGAACIAAIAAVIGYGDLVPGATELLTLYGRASGTFKDPNVLGAFLAPPVLFVLDRALASRRGKATLLLALAGLFSLGVLLSFSRGAWFVLACSVALYAWLAAVTTDSARQRLVLCAGAILALGLGAGVVVAALHNDGIRDLVESRASLTQSYDVGPEGRFGGQDKAIQLILEHPFGIGAQQFSGVHHHEEAHNVYLSMLLNAGWTGGLVYLLLTIVTVLVGIRTIALAPTGPNRRLAVIALAAFLPQAFEGLVVDIDHWRHAWLLVALIWGLASAPLAAAGARSIAPSPEAWE